MSDDPSASQYVEVYAPPRYGDTDPGSQTGLIARASFPPGCIVGQVGCPECGGSGWWGFGPEESINGSCIDCKGTGRVWVGLA